MRTFLRNVWKYRKVLADDADFDHAYLLRLLRVKFLNMADQLGPKGHTVNGPRHERQLRICAELARRLDEESYWKRVNDPLFSRRRKPNPDLILHNFKDAEKLRQADVDMLTGLMRRHLLSWWD